jgi:hypothetical protein
VLVLQDKPLIEAFTKNAEAPLWTLSEGQGLESSIKLPALNAKLTLADIFAKVKFPRKKQSS